MVHHSVAVAFYIYCRNIPDFFSLQVPLRQLGLQRIHPPLSLLSLVHKACRSILQFSSEHHFFSLQVPLRQLGLLRIHPPLPLLSVVHKVCHNLLPSMALICFSFSLPQLLPQMQEIQKFRTVQWPRPLRSLALFYLLLA